MFDLGIQELIVIFIVALLVFGPNKLPELGRTLGKGLAELKRAMEGVREHMDAEMHDLKRPLTLEPTAEKQKDEKTPYDQENQDRPATQEVKVEEPGGKDATTPPIQEAEKADQKGSVKG